VRHQNMETLETIANRIEEFAIVDLFYRCRLMYSKFFIYRVIICAIPIILMDIALISAMITGGYEGNLKAAILVGIVLHIVLYMLSRKQVNLLIQAFKQNGFKEIKYHP
ncbi:hypothetical protein Q604_UNBC12106G0001, partial [human gut metagenome]